LGTPRIRKGFNLDGDSQEQADIDAMDQDLIPSDLEEGDIDVDDEEPRRRATSSTAVKGEVIDVDELDTISHDSAAFKWTPGSHTASSSRAASRGRSRAGSHFEAGRHGGGSPSASTSTFKNLPPTDETPSKPRKTVPRRR